MISEIFREFFAPLLWWRRWRRGQAPSQLWGILDNLRAPLRRSLKESCIAGTLWELRGESWLEVQIKGELRDQLWSLEGALTDQLKEDWNYGE